MKILRKPGLFFLTFFYLLLSVFCLSKQPNLVIVMTDEHNFRTLGCYRDTLSEDQAFVWGEGVKVDTPNIDSLAADGALLTSFYVSSPVCSPSRAAFVTGLMPHVTGVPTNDVPMHDHMVTFAEVLGRNGYSTSYIGKWHLDGTAKPGWEPERKFGWQDNRYMFNRGHYKKLEETEDGPRVDAPIGNNGIPGYNLGEADEESYTTDFLMDRTLDFIRKNKGNPFCVMLSLPDPHGPNTVRDPYWEKYKGLKFGEPRTMFKTGDQNPGWSAFEGNNYIKDQKLNQEHMAAIFGMVECIDDNIGRMLNELRSLDIEDDTIVVFTSDHGDLMGEHRRHNKGVPFEASARVAFLIKKPGQIKAGKKIHTVMTSVDFAPTVLSLMGIKDKLPKTHGRDIFRRFQNNRLDIRSEQVSYIRATTNHPNWVAAVTDRYKLVISDKDRPWLYDLEQDPDELINFYEDRTYLVARKRLTEELKRLMENAQEPALKIEGFAKWL